MRNDINIRIKTNGPIFIKSDIKLTIGVLVSNHIKYIRKCMESIKPLLESVPSELIIVDTVGPEKSDGSLDVVKEYTDKIYHFDWINDFSAARNVAIDHAKGEWFMYLDDDEYFDDVKEFIDFFKSDECYKYNVGYYYTGDYVTPDTYKKSVAGRMVRRTEETRFAGIVHEGFVNAYYPVKQFLAFTHHFGYLFENEEQKKAKTKRNLTLLEKEFAQKGPSARLCAQIVQEIMIFDREEGSKRCSEYIKILEEKGSMEESCAQWLLVSRIRFMAAWRNLDGILEIEKMTLEKYPLSETARLAIAQQVAAVAFANGNYEITADRVKTYCKLWDWLMSHDQERTIQSNLDLPSFMLDTILFNTLKIGIESERRLKHYETAVEYIKRLDFDCCIDFKEIKGLIRSVLSHLKDDKEMVEWYRQFYKDEIIDDPKNRKYLPKEMRKRSTEQKGLED